MPVEAMPVETWLIFILGFMLVGSIVALELKDLLSAIIAVGVVGLGVSMAFLLLEAPDLAIVQFLFEIFSVVIMVRAFMKKEYHSEGEGSKNRLLWGITVLTLGAVFLLSVNLFRALPPFGVPLLKTAAYYLANCADQTQAANIVASIVLDYRAYDTLGEVTVLFTAILGALTIIRIKTKGTSVGEEQK
jgi:multisubunit Na+/H+ antiporter MnhB subunit